jgi:hypothetical protein
MSLEDVYNKITASEAGVYMITSEGLVDYTDRWAYGYMVGLRPLEMGDLTPWTLVAVGTNEGGRYYDLVQHVGARQDAVRLAKTCNQRSIYDLRAEKVVYV